MTNLCSITTPTPDGDFHIIVDENDIAHASGFGTLDNLADRLPNELQSTAITPIARHPYQNLVRAYYTGDATALTKIPYTQQGTDFQKRVWDVISTIPFGQTITYKQLAKRSGNPAAVRAAGTICGLNRLILIIPCHRILKSDGTTGNYLYGPTIKTSLLRHESVL